MQVWEFKRCPRCGGNIFINEDSVGPYMQCLQCGYERQIRKLVKVQGAPTHVSGLHHQQ